MKKGISALILLSAMLLGTGCGAKAVIDTGEPAVSAVDSVETVVETVMESRETVEYSEDPVAKEDCFGEDTEEDIAATARPEATVKPEATAEPVFTAKPEATAEPEATAKPGATVKPEVTVEPEATAKPEVTATPEATAKPEVTATPEATAEPVAPTEEPGNIVPSEENSSTGAVQLPEDSFF